MLNFLCINTCKEFPQTILLEETNFSPLEVRVALAVGLFARTRFFHRRFVGVPIFAYHDFDDVLYVLGLLQQPHLELTVDRLDVVSQALVLADAPLEGDEEPLLLLMGEVEGVHLRTRIHLFNVFVG